MALAWPLDKYECLTVDTTRLSDTRKWGREPRPDEGDGMQAAGAGAGPGAGPAAPAPKPKPEGAEWGGPLGILMRLTGRGVKRPRESNGEGGGGGQAVQRAPHKPENPWQVCVDMRRFGFGVSGWMG